MMKAGDPRARCQQLLEHMPVHLSAHLEGWSGLEVRGAELDRGSSQSWARQSSAEGLHQLHGSVVLEGGGR